MSPTCEFCGETEQAPLPTGAFQTWKTEAGDVAGEFYRVSCGYLLRYPGIADFQFSTDGSSCKAWLVPGIDRQAVDYLFNGHLVPLLLNQSRWLVFHGSSVDVGIGAIAFLGESGQGKSTLAASFSKNGAPFLSDDFICLDPLECGGFEVVPIDPSLRLLDPSFDALVGSVPDLATRAIDFGGKARVRASDNLPFCSEPRTLLAAFVLQKTDTNNIRISPLSGAPAHLAWIGSNFHVDVADGTALFRQMVDVACVSNGIPTFTLDYPRSFTGLGDLRKTILRKVEDIVRSAADRVPSDETAPSDPRHPL